MFGNKIKYLITTVEHDYFYGSFKGRSWGVSNSSSSTLMLRWVAPFCLGKSFACDLWLTLLQCKGRLHSVKVEENCLCLSVYQLWGRSNELCWTYRWLPGKHRYLWSKCMLFFFMCTSQRLQEPFFFCHDLQLTFLIKSAVTSSPIPISVALIPLTRGR